MDANDEQAIRELVRQWELAWNAGDMSAAARLFFEDADFVNVRGSHWHGRAQIEAEHVQRHLRQLKGSVFAPMEVGVQHISGDAALAHVRWHLHNDHELDGTPRQPRQGVFSWLVLREAPGRWCIRSAHNTNITADNQAMS
ncbi:SgcJ/EcaC family oxidoreductase [Variovorax sp. J22R133]|uniref:SgcJ/EcaC family oxidoreductase n=1 Tax=Variovorax brevis TaxID=3053503 RepID=UPI0025769E6A|nr:SgcJ/EcaC family oxidoreductase [Variovorax sp. J22R133]MDM0113732.1 SgcJ/EcaC family oxidoreductase [Variovorax sp. J22R133]